MKLTKIVSLRSVQIGRYMALATCFLVFQFCVPGASAAAPGVQQRDLIQEAEQAYIEGDYNRSIAAFEKLTAQVPEDPVVLFNLGMVYMQAGQRGRAIWRYLQGYQVSPRDKQIHHRIRNISTDLFDQMAITPIPPLNRLYESLTMNEWGSLMVVSGGLFALLWTLYFIIPPNHLLRVKIRVVVIFLGVMTLVIYPLGLTRYYHEEVIVKGVVVEEETVARTGPDEDQIETFALPAGTIVEVDEVLGDKKWLKISFAGGRVGFVPGSSVEFL